MNEHSRDRSSWRSVVTDSQVESMAGTGIRRIEFFQRLKRVAIAIRGLIEICISVTDVGCTSLLEPSALALDASPTPIFNVSDRHRFGLVFRLTWRIRNDFICRSTTCLR